jgi:hypothetical protein
MHFPEASMAECDVPGWKRMAIADAIGGQGDSHLKACPLGDET